MQRTAHSAGTRTSESVCTPMQAGPVGIVKACGLINSKGQPVDVEKELANTQVVGLYFTASWCPPCRRFTPTLAEFCAKNPRFKVIVVSGDRNEHDFLNYLEKYEEFLAIPFGSAAKSAVVAAMNCSMMPTLHIHSFDDGELLTTWGKAVVSENPDAFACWIARESGVFHGKIIGKYIFAVCAVILVLTFMTQNLLPKAV